MRSNRLVRLCQSLAAPHGLLRTPWGSAGVREMWRHRAQQRSTPVKREAVIAGLASEGLALILGSAEAGSSAVVGPMPTDPVEFASVREIWRR